MVYQPAPVNSLKIIVILSLHQDFNFMSVQAMWTHLEVIFPYTVRFLCYYHGNLSTRKRWLYRMYFVNQFSTVEEKKLYFSQNNSWHRCFDNRTCGIIIFPLNRDIPALTCRSQTHVQLFLSDQWPDFNNILNFSLKTDGKNKCLESNDLKGQL
jgi:hypothetical protein